MKDAPSTHLLKSMSEPPSMFPGFGEPTLVDTPHKCLMCGASYRGGATEPGEKMKRGCRVFYARGASHSVKEPNPFTKDKQYFIFMKNCFNTDGGAHEDDPTTKE